MKYKISTAALEDLEKIWLYTFENWSFEQADHYYNLIMNKIEFLAKKPKSGKDFNDIRKGYFRSQVKSHFIFYKINLST
jgi:toxin ParE1/3/4